MREVRASFGRCDAPDNGQFCVPNKNEYVGHQPSLSAVSDSFTLMTGAGVPVKSRASGPFESGHGGSVSVTSPLGQNPAVFQPFSPVLLKSVSAPVLPSYKPQDQRLPKPESCSLVSADEFAGILGCSSSEDLLIFDVRPFNDYSRCSVRKSIHVCLPSTLLRRKTFTFQKLLANLPPDEQVLVREKASSSERLKVVIYDNVPNQKDDSVSLACSGIASKVLDHEAKEMTLDSVSILSCGFAQFEEAFSEYTVSEFDSPTSHSNSSTMDLQVQVSGDMIQESRHGLMPPRTIALDSPISASSPISALSKFKLPALDNSPSQVFKIAQNEQLMDLESYLSAVNIKEENDQGSMKTFQFPKPSQGSPAPVNLSKLRFQIKYEDLEETCGRLHIAAVIPLWFRKLMRRSKIDFISQFQRLDFLERKRLNRTVNQHKTSQSVSFFPGRVSNDNSCPFKGQLRSHSQPSANTRRSSLQHFYAVNSDEEDDTITISSGVELGIKNRYKDIFPYEHSRVVLKKNSVGSIPACSVSSVTSTDFNETWESYINANYLNVPMFPSLPKTHQRNPKRVRYIATQAPLSSTVHDFFTCILNNDVPLVVTLTDSFENGVEKCYPYWKQGEYDGIKIDVLEEVAVPIVTKSKETEIFLRRLQLSYDDGKTFETLQLHIVDWPDLGTLLDPTQIIQTINLKNFVINELLDKEVYAEGSVPVILVHCSAGCGRTGTWCTVDSIISHLDAYDVLQGNFEEENSSATTNTLFDPIVWTINTFRKQRISIVQNVNQFLFVYDCLLYYFTLNLNGRDHMNGQLPVEGSSMQNLLHQIKELKILQSVIDVKTHEQVPSFA